MEYRRRGWGGEHNSAETGKGSRRNVGMISRHINMESYCITESIVQVYRKYLLSSGRVLVPIAYDKAVRGWSVILIATCYTFHTAQLRFYSGPRISSFKLAATDKVLNCGQSWRASSDIGTVRYDATTDRATDER